MEAALHSTPLPFGALPADVAHGVAQELRVVLALLTAASREDAGQVADEDGLMDAESRRDMLLHLADSKVRGALKALAKHV